MKLNPTQEFRLIPGAQLADRIEAARAWPTTRLFDLSLVRARRRQMAKHILARVGAGERSTINFVRAQRITVVQHAMIGQH